MNFYLYGNKSAQARTLPGIKKYLNKINMRKSSRVTIGEVCMMSRVDPGSHHDLEDGVKPVESQEVVDGRLGGWLGPHAPGRVFVVHQVETPEEIVDFHNVLVTAAEVGNQTVQLGVHPLSLLLPELDWLRQNLLDCRQGWKYFIGAEREGR